MQVVIQADPHKKRSKYRKTQSILCYFLWLLYLNADWCLSKHYRLNIFLWASVPILDFLDQQGKFTTSTTFVTKLTLVAKAYFVRKILVLRCRKFGQLVDRVLENKSLHDAHMNAPSARRVLLWRIFLALPVMNGPLPAELKCRENTGFIWHM